jgi:hypothetical protein
MSKNKNNFEIINSFFLLLRQKLFRAPSYVIIFEAHLLIFDNFMDLINSRNMEYIKRIFYVLILTFQTLHFTKTITLSLKYPLVVHLTRQIETDER